LNAYISYFATFAQDVSISNGSAWKSPPCLPWRWEQYATSVHSVVIADLGHWLPEEHPQEVVQHLLFFFAEERDARLLI
jgi:pimeloyl-ACP methyl ester carboxylesterase